MHSVIILGTGVARVDAPVVCGSTLASAYRAAYAYCTHHGFTVVLDNGNDPSRTANRLIVSTDPCDNSVAVASIDA